MKTKTVKYYDLFDHEIMVATNKLLHDEEVVHAYTRFSERASVKNMPKEQKEEYYREKAQHTECRCFHFNGIGAGYCSYRTCRHDARSHP